MDYRGCKESDTTKQLSLSPSSLSSCLKTVPLRTIYHKPSKPCRALGLAPPSPIEDGSPEGSYRKGDRGGLNALPARPDAARREQGARPWRQSTAGWGVLGAPKQELEQPGG